MTQSTNNMRIGMTFISLIFFIFGFVTTFIVTLSDPVMEAFNLTYTQGFLINSAFFISYAVFSIPSGYVVKKAGYKNSIVAGLLLIALAGFSFFPAIRTESYGFFLSAILILSLGVVLLQTSANPYVTALGPEETASGRLNLTTALNSIATWLAPLVIVALILPSVGTVTSEPQAAEVLTESARVQPSDLLLPFILIAVIVLLISLAIMRIRLPKISQEGTGSYASVLKYPHVILGALAIFFYVGAEVGIGTAISSYVVKPGLGGGISRELALKFAGLYWAGAMIGRFFGAISMSGITRKKLEVLFVLMVLCGSFVVGFITLEYSFAKALTFFGFALVNYGLMRLGKGNANTVLSIFSAAAATLAIISIFSVGKVTLWSIVSIGLFNSVMFPNIFALIFKGLDQSEVSLAAGVTNTLIVGGACIPIIMGMVGDRFGIQWSFVVPVVCYLYILYYALAGSWAGKKKG